MSAEATGQAVDPALHLELSAFLFREARLLDEGRFEDWLALLAEDIAYEMPLTLTRERSESERVHDPRMGYFSENIHSLRTRVARLRTDYAWAEDPPTRTRHLLSNLEARELEDGRYEVRSAFVVYASRGNQTGWDQFVGGRRDTIERVEEGLLLTRRLLLLDQAMLGANSISIFL
ncbi:MAG: aromatic-ring-hydroxylating dioxygenase subunit beta [Actinobacteria bacterium]|nr:aromatic-ring-hydroxylating dioxygenase subunit beta [Actinomycetota bacterium]